MGGEVMKVIVSSKTLAAYLHSFDWKESRIERVGYFDGKLHIESDDYRVEIDCEVSHDSRIVWLDQRECRWDWLEDVVRRISEQPVVLEISINRLQLILSF